MWNKLDSILEHKTNTVKPLNIKKQQIYRLFGSEPFPEGNGFDIAFEQLEPKGYWMNGIKGEGVYYRWFSNNNTTCQLEEESHWTNGKQEGPYLHWSPNGNLDCQCTFKNGKLTLKNPKKSDIHIDDLGNEFPRLA
jgi:antitoxin component YwqK of YwqJK toxin-antitoxin module